MSYAGASPVEFLALGTPLTFRAHCHVALGVAGKVVFGSSKLKVPQAHKTGFPTLLIPAFGFIF